MSFQLSRGKFLTVLGTLLPVSGQKAARVVLARRDIGACPPLPNYPFKRRIRTILFAGLVAEELFFDVLTVS